jgi:hypothetical protein
MSAIPSDLHSDVVKRAMGRCEYCQLSQVGQEATFHVDHVMPRASGGATELNNLALACVSCSLRKWAKESAIDPQSGKEAPLFNPRRQIWSDHFSWSNEVVVPKTGIGRATVAALSMNRPLIMAIRREEAVRGRHPPEE